MMPDAKRTIRRLTRDEFADALRKGLGRALLHVRRYGLDEVADLVLEACLHCQIYDVECETSRGAWLFQMFRDSPRYSEFSEAIRGQFEEGRERSAADAFELCSLLKEMALNGDAVARQTLGEIARNQASLPDSGDPAGEQEWVDVEGRDALLELARIYGRRVRFDPTDRVPDHFLFLQGSEEEVKKILLQSIQTDPDIKAYWDYLAAHGAFDPPSSSRLSSTGHSAALLGFLKAFSAADVFQPQQRERVRRQISVESILQDARNGQQTWPVHYSTFGRHATADELKEIYTHLLAEADESVQLRLLYVFGEAPLPELNELIFRWAEGTCDELRDAAIVALALHSDERVHELARSKARAGQLAGPDVAALRLFLNNYGGEDAGLITQALGSLTPNRDDAHRLARNLVKLAEKARDVLLAEALKWGYEITPCVNCRFRMVKQLVIVDRLDESIRYECKFDSDEDIREFAKTLPITGFEPTEHRWLGKLRDRDN